ncbi:MULTISPECIES: spore germination protein [unclassified Paenibacillus]|uniref:spore germination protein n=1 Tax=unclassified Paenibacillus TaxID=185978 RepID=UPI001C101AEA|nr:MULTISPECIES: spore germination protein [unclassified Paenibacillus]MBU5443528.1 spore germination protein [Paenibacillus sp. MSJ-34]CAH0120565.1 putative spore germination protein GerPA [Paenibacillus sp. CECT 9249]
MPAIIGNIKIVNVGPSSNVQMGDTAAIVLTSNSKSYAGANSFTTGDSIGTNIANNQGSGTNTNDPDVVDNSTAKGV